MSRTPKSEHGNCLTDDKPAPGELMQGQPVDNGSGSSMAMSTEQAAADWRERNRAAIERYNAYVEAVGVFSDRIRTF
jgi:hypothetical protein